MNVCIITGRLTKDPHKTEAGAYFTLAVEHDYKDEDGTKGADFLPISVYGAQADHVCKYLVKGDMINVIARATSYRKALPDKQSVDKISFKLQKYEFVKVKHFARNTEGDLQAAPDAELPDEMIGGDIEEE